MCGLGSYTLARAQAGLAKLSYLVRYVLAIVSCRASRAFFGSLDGERVLHAYGCVYLLSLFMCSYYYVVYRLTSVQSMYLVSIVLHQIIKYYCRGAYIAIVVTYYGKGYQCQRRDVMGSCFGSIHYGGSYYYLHGRVALRATIMTSHCYLYATLYLCPIDGSLYDLAGGMSVRSIYSYSGGAAGSNYSGLRDGYRALLSLVVVSLSFYWFERRVYIFRIYYRPTLVLFLVRLGRSCRLLGVWGCYGSTVRHGAIDL